MDKERNAMEELKEIDMNYLNNEESDPDEMFTHQQSGNKKGNRHHLSLKKKESEKSLEPFKSPYIDAELRQNDDNNEQQEESQQNNNKDKDNNNEQEEVNENVNISGSSDRRPDIDEAELLRDVLVLNKGSNPT